MYSYCFLKLEIVMFFLMQNKYSKEFILYLAKKVSKKS